MYNDDLTALDTAGDLESPLDHLAEGGLEAPQYDPEAMLPLLESAEAQQRMLGARAFCEIQDERAVPHLIRLLTDNCPLVRVSAAYALGRNPSPDAVTPIITQINLDWNGYVRKGLVWALGNCRDLRSLEPLIDALKTDISAVRLWAASSLAQMMSFGAEAVEAAAGPLSEALRSDPIETVRSNCAWALGQLCRELPSNDTYEAAISALIEAFEEDEDLGVREDARAAILKLGDPHGLQVIEEIEREGML